MWSELDRTAMSRAIELAGRGAGRVAPNPPVGCVLVRDDRIIAEGWHDRLGGLHAEQHAIHDAEQRGETTNGSVAYVTLEPCNHFGRTPPCSEALMWAGVSEVVIAHPDPNPTVRGRGAEALELAGIRTRTGLMQSEAARTMHPFLHWCTTRRPLVTAKIVTDPHGSVDDLSEGARRFSSSASLDLAHDLRAMSDAILVGVGTVLRDDPHLTVRRGRQRWTGPPLRVLIDPHLRVPPTSRILDDEAPTMVLHTAEGDVGSEHVECIQMAAEGHVPPSRILDLLGDREHQRLLIEGGPVTLGRFIEAGCVDVIHHISCPQEHLKPVGVDLDALLQGYDLVEQRMLGEDCLRSYARKGS